MTTATQTRTTTEAASSSDRFNALVLGFDSLVATVRADGITDRTSSMISELDAMAVAFMSRPHLLSGAERRIGLRIENAVYAALRGRATRRGFVPYTADEMVCVLIAGIHGFPDATFAVAKEIAAVATENFTVFRSAGSIVVPSSK